MDVSATKASFNSRTEKLQERGGLSGHGFGEIEEDIMEVASDVVQVLLVQSFGDSVN